MSPTPPIQPSHPTGPGPQPPYHAPEYTVDPNLPPQQQQSLRPQPSGQYEVMPSLPASNNTGHSGHNPYEFIVNPNTPKQSRSLLGGGNNLALRIAVLGGVLVVILIIAAIIISALSPKSSTADLVGIAQQQQEIIRIATAASTQATGQGAQNLASTVELTVTSSQNQVTSYLAAHHKKLNPKILAVDQSTQTDALLANATSAGTYDTVVTQTLSSQLEAYENQLQTSFKQSSSATAKQVLQNCYTTAVKLVAQAKGLSS